MHGVYMISLKRRKYLGYRSVPGKHPLPLTSISWGQCTAAAPVQMYIIIHISELISACMLAN